MGPGVNSSSPVYVSQYTYLKNQRLSDLTWKDPLYSKSLCLTSSGVLANVRGTTTSLDSKNTNSEPYFMQKIIHRMIPTFRLPSSNAPQVKMLPQRPGLINFRSLCICGGRDRGELLQSTISAPKYSLTLTGKNFPSQTKPLSLGRNTYLKKTITRKFPGSPGSDSGQWGSLVGLGDIWGLLCPWKRYLISLDFQRWLPA